MNSNTIYYLVLYIIVFVIRYFKLKKEFVIQDSTIPEHKQFNYKQVFFVSIEILYSAAGFIIILLDIQKKWTAVIVSIYLLLVLISSNLSSMEERFSDNFKLRSHLFIIAVIIFGTIYTFKMQSIQEETKCNITKDSILPYKVVIPYIDKSFVNHMGYDKVGDKRFFYLTKTEGKNELEAIAKAENNFWNDSLLLPLINKKNELKKNLLKIDKDYIIVKIIKQ